MKKQIATILQYTIIILAIPFILFDNQKVLNKVDKWFDELNWWGKK